MKPPISLVELEYMRLPKRAKKDALSYAKHRVNILKLTLNKAEKNENFRTYVDYIYGRLTEANQIYDLLKYMNMKKKT